MLTLLVLNSARDKQSSNQDKHKWGSSIQSVKEQIIWKWKSENNTNYKSHRTGEFMLSIYKLSLYILKIYNSARQNKKKENKGVLAKLLQKQMPK